MRKIAPFVAMLTIPALFAGCGGGSGVRFSELFDQSAAAEGTGVQFTGVVRAVVILATHDASAHQRQVAEQNGRRAVAKLRARAAEAPAASPTKPHHRKTVAAEEPTKTKQKPEAETAPAAKPKSAPKLPRIIAITTEKDEHTDKRAAKAVMLFDTHSEKIIGNKVYDIEKEPRAGEEVRFETHSSSYIGASL